MLQRTEGDTVLDAQPMPRGYSHFGRLPIPRRAEGKGLRSDA